MPSALTVTSKKIGNHVPKLLQVYDERIPKNTITLIPAVSVFQQEKLQTHGRGMIRWLLWWAEGTQATAGDVAAAGTTHTLLLV